MKNRIILLSIFLLLVSGGLWLLLRKDSAVTKSPPPDAETQALTYSKRGSDADRTSENPSTHGTQQAATAEASVSEDIKEFVRRTIEDPTYEWKHPINFYGKVLDENDEPVAGAHIDFVWNDLSPEGTSRATTASDQAGLFSLLNKTGKALSVTARKDGYYSARDARHASFEYAYPEWKFIPDPNRPVIFHLRKKGEAEPLVHGLKLFGSRVDGTPSYVDFATGKIKLTPPGDVLVQCTRSESNRERRFDWTFTLSVPDGGLIESTEEFMFLAPEEGYEPSIEIGYQADDANWRSQEKRKFFIKSRNGQHYARIEITLLPSYRDKAAYDLEWFLNPNSSRNLEFDPDKVIRVNQ